MNSADEKERNAKIEKIIRLFNSLKTSEKRISLEKLIEKEDFHNKDQTEEEYQAEQREWLKKIQEKKRVDEGSADKKNKR